MGRWKQEAQGSRIKCGNNTVGFLVSAAAAASTSGADAKHVGVGGVGVVG